MRGLPDRRIILTGGASGIGRAATVRLAEEGCVVGIFDLNLDGARETAALCPAGRVSAYKVDIADRDQVTQAMAEFERDRGPTEGIPFTWDVLTDIQDTEDTKEGFRSFVEKRKPRFTGR